MFASCLTIYIFSKHTQRPRDGTELPKNSKLTTANRGKMQKFIETWQKVQEPHRTLKIFI